MLIKSEPQKPVNADRRAFLKWTGATLAASTLLVQACKKDDDDNTPTGATIKLVAGDIGVLNYAYALEQLENAFYETVVTHSAFTTTFTSEQQRLLRAIRDHEQAHARLFKAALGTSAIQGLTPDFSSVNFGDKQSVLATAMAFEDLGVAAYNGAGYLISDNDYLTLAGKIVSVEARHAAWIRDQINNGTFADLGSLAGSGADNSKGLDAALLPTQVVAIANNYIEETLDASNLA